MTVGHRGGEQQLKFECDTSQNLISRPSLKLERINGLGRHEGEMNA